MSINELRAFVVREYGFEYEEVSILTAIMGVPITFLDKYNPSQFEIVGVFNHGKDGPWDYATATVNGIDKYKRLAIRKISL